MKNQRMCFFNIYTYMYVQVALTVKECVNSSGSEFSIDPMIKFQGNFCLEVHVLTRDEKEGRKKQARSNKQQGKATQHTQGSHVHTEMNNEYKQRFFRHSYSKKNNLE